MSAPRKATLTSSLKASSSDGDATTPLCPVPGLHCSPRGKDMALRNCRTLHDVVVLKKHLASSSSWADSGHTDVGVQGKQPQDKNTSGLAHLICVVWSKGAAALCIHQGTCHPPRHPAVKGTAIFPVQFLENPAVKSQRPKLTYSPPSNLSKTESPVSFPALNI